MPSPPKSALVPSPLPVEVLVPLLIWQIINTIDVVNVVLTISTFPVNEGLLPGENSFVDRPLPPGLDENKLKKSQFGVDDYNSNRVLTATWTVVDLASGLGKWEIAGKIIEELVPNNQFPFADLLNLTAGQIYYWGVEAKSLIRGTIHQSDGQFYLPLVEPASSTIPILPPASTAYSSVTFLTPDATVADPTGLKDAEKVANSIVNDIDGKGTKGTVMEYVADSGNWKVISGDQGLGKPLVLIGNWSADSTVENFNSGFSEAAADSMFAALVKLNQSYGVTDVTQKDALFNSSFHFIGFGRGAVVNNEIIQRLGTIFPRDKYDKMFPDLQMTMVDPYELNGEPEIQVWENVTFADNYYQTATTTHPKGKAIAYTDFSVHLGGVDAGGNLDPNSRAGFTLDVSGDNNPHERAFAWYDGTVNLSWGKDNPLDIPILRRSGDFSYSELFDPNFPDAQPWYTPNHTGQSPGDDNAQWEGVGTGWYYSVLGGGYYQRQDLPSVVGQRVPVSFDNTSKARMRGDFAVPTLFDGNFDAISNIMVDQLIPGWSLHGGNNEPNQVISQAALRNWSDIDVENRANYPDNFALELQSGQSIVHNRFVVPDWGALRFDLYTGDVTADAANKLRVTIQSVDGSVAGVSTEINLQEATGAPAEYLADTRRIGYGEQDFETFTLDIPDALRGKMATVSFVLDGGSPVYLDNVFFKSQHLLFGNPSEARKPDNAELFRNNYLLEKAQYVVSYDPDKQTPNWVAEQLNKAWVGSDQTRTFRPDPTLPSGWAPS